MHRMEFRMLMMEQANKISEFNLEGDSSILLSNACRIILLTLIIAVLNIIPGYSNMRDYLI